MFCAPRSLDRIYGITTALEWRGELIAVSKGSHKLLKIDMKDIR
jgi:hypothetical protein